MKKSTIFKLLFSAMVMFAVTAFTACVDDNSDEGIPYLQVTPDVLTYELSGGTSTLEIKTNRAWSIEVGDAAWVRPEFTSGNGDASVPVNVFASEVAQRAEIKIVLRNKYDVYASKIVTILQGEVGPVTVIYNETFGQSGATGSPYLFLDQYTDYVKTGEGAVDVDYTGSSGVSARQSGKLSAGYENASGHTKAFFGSNASLVINKIALKSDQTNLTLNFGGSYSKNNNGTYDNTFYADKFHVYLSADGTTWSNALEYTFKKADDFWVYASVNFSLKNPVAMLYVKMVADEASVFAIDDPTLITSAGGQEVDLATGAVTVTTKTPTDITETGATLSGTVSTTEGVTAVGFQYAVNAAPIDWSAATKVTADAVAATFTKAVTGLVTGTTYAVRAFAEVEGEEVVGTVTTFTPSAGPSGDQIITDFTAEATYPADFPISKNDKAVGPQAYTFDGATYTLAAANTDGVYYRGKEYKGERYYLMIGKKGAYIELPAMTGKALTSVECFVPKAASVNVQAGISTTAGADVSGGAAIAWAAQNEADRTYTYTLTGTAENTKYRLYITAAEGNDIGYNAQIYKLTLNYGSSTPAGPSITLNPTSLSFTADADNTGKTIAVTVANQGANILYAESSDNVQFPTTLSGTTVTVKAQANATTTAKTATVKVYLAAGPGMTRIDEKTVTISQAAQGTTPSGDAYYHTNVGTANVSSNPLIANYTDWNATGSGAANVTYSADGTISVRSSGKTSAGAYEGASGPNAVFFGGFADGGSSSAFKINNIAVLSSQTKMSLSFGGNYSFRNSDNTYDNAWKNDQFLVSLSSDGTTWTPITYTKTGGDDTKDPFWVFNTADFTLKSGVSAVYIKFEAKTASVIRLDDINLAPSTTGGQEIDLGSGGATTPTVSVNPTSLSFTADADNTGKTIAVTVANQGANILYAESSDNVQFPTTLSGTTVTVKALANATTTAKTATVKVYLAEGPGMTRIDEKTVTISQAAQGSTPTPGATTITFNTPDVATPAIPAPADAGAARTAYVIGGLTYYLYADKDNSSYAGKYQWQDNSSYQGAVAPFTGLYLKNGYMEVPAVAGKKLTAVTLTSTGGMGGGVEAGIYDTNGQVVVTSEAFTKTAPLTLGLDGAANTAYRIQITKGNAQIHQIELIYSDGGVTPAVPNITGVDPTSLTWAADGVNGQTIAVSGTDISGNLTTSFSGSAFTAAVNGTTVTVTPKAANTSTTTDVVETLTISATGGNSKTVTLTQSKVSGGSDAPTAGTVLWSEDFGTFGGNSTTFTTLPLMSDYDYSGQTLYKSGDTVTYTWDGNNNVRATTSTGTNCTAGHLWFNKSTEGLFQTSAITLYGATSLELSYSQGTSSSQLVASYSTDGTNWTELGKSGPIEKQTYDITVPAATVSVYIKIQHLAANGKNTRGDNFALTVK